MSSFCDVVNFSITIQPRPIIPGPHKDHGGYMAAKHVLSDYVKFTSSFHNYNTFSIVIQPRFTISSPHIDDGGYISVFIQMPPELNLVTLY